MSKFADLKKRFFMYSGMIILFGLIIFFSDLHFMRFIVALSVSGLAALAALEYSALVKKKEIVLSNNILIGGIICEIIAFFIYSQYPQLKLLPLLVFLIFMVFLFISNFKNIQGSLLRISTAAFGFLYVAIPLGMVLPILYLEVFEMQEGRIWLFYLIFVTKITDIGAYFGGKLFGKKKLASEISPKKTIFGSISGLVFAIAGSLLFLIFSKNNMFDFALFEAIVLGLILGVFAQFGDLCESLIKRDMKIKDSSKLPGIGGILDMLDSLIFNIPILYIFLIG